MCVCMCVYVYVYVDVDVYVYVYAVFQEEEMSFLDGWNEKGGRVEGIEAEERIGEEMVS